MKGKERMGIVDRLTMVDKEHSAFIIYSMILCFSLHVNNDH